MILKWFRKLLQLLLDKDQQPHLYHHWEIIPCGMWANNKYNMCLWFGLSVCLAVFHTAHFYTSLTALTNAGDAVFYTICSVWLEGHLSDLKQTLMYKWSIFLCKNFQGRFWYIFGIKKLKLNRRKSTFIKYYT